MSTTSAIPDSKTIQDAKDITSRDIRLEIAMLVIVVVCFIFRMVSRLAVSRIFAIEDWVMILAFVCGVTGSCALIQNNFWTLNALDFRLEYVDRVNMMAIGTTVLCLASITFTRISFGFFFLSIFQHKRPQRIFIWSAVAITCVCAIVYIPFDSIICPRVITYKTCARPWTLTTGYINADNALFVLVSLTIIIGDFGFVIMAIFALYHVQLPIIQKIPVGVLLALGTVDGVFCTIRMAIRIQLWIDPSNTSNAVTGNLSTLRWMFLEVAVALITANLVLTRPLFSLMAKKIGLVTTNTNKSVSRTRMDTTFTSPEGKYVIRKDTAVSVLEGDSSSKPGFSYAIDEERALESEKRSDHLVVDQPRRSPSRSL